MKPNPSGLGVRKNRARIEATRAAPNCLWMVYKP